MKHARTHSKEVKQRFVQAIELLSNERYPKEKTIRIVISLGLSPTNYYRLRVTDNNYPTLDQCVMLCDQYAISAEWLLLGKGYMKKIETKNLTPLELIKQAVQMMENPVKVIVNRKSRTMKHK